MEIDLLITSVIRPNIIKQTIKSWEINLKNNNTNNSFNVIINIDPVGDSYNPKYIKQIVSNSFNIKDYFIPSRPSFPLAVRRLWERADTDFVLFIEDDMLLLQSININKMLEIMDTYNIDVLRLDKRGCNSDNSEIKRKSKCDYVDNFYKFRSYEYGLSLNPSLYKISIIKELYPYFIDGTSPERILRSKKTEETDEVLKKYNYGICMKPGDSAYVKDIGTKWKKSKKLKKPGSGVTSTWVKSK